MRMVITGDKSRYQFLRSLVSAESLSIGDCFYTEQMSEKDIIVSSAKNNENIYYSSFVPLNSLLFFPSEYGNCDMYCTDDRILFFNEFPYNREDDLEKLKDIINSGKFGQISVVLVCNFREGIDTDISSNDMAITSAENLLDEIGIDHYKYKIGEKPNFLFWRIDKKGHFEKNMLKPLLSKVKEDLAVFDTTYDFLYELDVAMIVDDPNIRKMILKYDRALLKKNVWREYAARSYNCLFKTDKSIENFYVDVYKKLILPVASWNLKKDILDLQKVVETTFKNRFDSLGYLCFSGGEEDYEAFLNENRIIFLLGQILDKFFRNELKSIICERTARNMEIVEELLYECDD